ncbi:toll/interleukin-1 receptor-like protein [Eucalyptus grandis]|uniref:toll/interleukin-1 receptor-like protein n=1 Tax=Eucalyptus grandis TaxID=71139 RepID=UPI00192EE90F|nr:toll/interleukin-1 receptor-like protein [Eucalyptus grandis]
MDKGQKSAEKESTKGVSAPFIPQISSGRNSSQYDVFLSFRGSDTRKAFTDHLYNSLVNIGIVPICVFRDDNNIPIGKEFGSYILDAITCSRILIPIISENYASSKWCLRSFGEAFHSSKEHFDEKDIQEGQRALSEVSYLNGWESEKFANGYFASA